MTWRIALVLLCLAWLSGPAHAVQVYVDFHSVPPVEKVTNLGSGDLDCPRLAGYGFTVELDPLQPVHLQLSAGEFRYVVEAPGSLFANGRDARNVARYPADGRPLMLEPTTARAQVAFYLWYSPVRWAIYGLVLAVAVAVPAWARSRRQAALRLQQAAAALQQVEQLEGSVFENRIVGGYRVGRKLGAGGMGAVYEGVPVEGGPKVALKIIMTGDDPENVQRARREIQAMASLTHPNIVRLLTEGQTAEYFYIAMELISGGTLEGRLRPGGMPVQEVVEVVRGIVRAVWFAHQRGFIHRDLKPGNVMFTATGQVKVMDFGLARKEKVSAKITRTGTVLGTPAYISPEQIKGDEATPAIDQYSLGVMLWEMLGGHLPFDGEPMDILMRHMSDEPPSLLDERPDLPPDLCDAVMRMMAKEPGDRFANLEAALSALEAGAARRG